MQRKAYQSDVSNEEWAFVAPYLTLMTEDAPQRTHSPREVFNVVPAQRGRMAGKTAAESAAAHGLRLEVVKLPEAKLGFVLLPRRWFVERVSRGRRASAAWREIMRGCRRHSPVCIFRPSRS